jgi:serine/threonine-protein kinase
MAAMPDLRPVEGKYEILRKLREGGMGAIFLVRHRLLDEQRVVKVLRAQLKDERELRDRFVREARTAIHLRHPNVAQLYEFEVDVEGTAYMVLEFIDGRTIEELIAAGGGGSLRLKLEVASQCLRALGFLHRKGFVHRDIAPDNIMLTRDPEGAPHVKLLDLGIVKVLKGDEGLTGASVFLGKVRYAAPEQLEGGAIDARTDLYSFGVLLYELMTGIHPYPGRDVRSVLSGHLFKPPVPFEVSDPDDHVPASVRELILTALEKDREKRFASAEEFRRRLEALPEWREPLDDQDLPALSFDAEPRLPAPPAATSAQRRLDEHFDADRRTPPPETGVALANGARAEAAAAQAAAPEPVEDEAARERRAAAADGLRRRVHDLIAEKRFEEARWLVLGEAFEVLSAREADTLMHELEWHEASERQLRVEISLSTAESALATSDFEAARQALAEARALVPRDPRVLALARRLDAVG